MQRLSAAVLGLPSNHSAFVIKVLTLRVHLVDSPFVICTPSPPSAAAPVISLVLPPRFPGRLVPGSAVEISPPYLVLPSTEGGCHAFLWTYEATGVRVTAADFRGGWLEKLNLTFLVLFLKYLFGLV